MFNDDVSSARLRHRTIFLRQFQTSFEASFHVAQNDFVSVALKENDARVDDVLTCRAPMNVFAGVVGKNPFEFLEQRDNRYRAFEEFADCLNVEQFGFGVFVDDVGFFFRDNAEFALSFGKSSFYIQSNRKNAEDDSPTFFYY